MFRLFIEESCFDVYTIEQFANTRELFVYIFKSSSKIEIEHFIDCIQNGTKCITNVEHAKKVIEILAHE